MTDASDYTDDTEPALTQRPRRLTTEQDAPRRVRLIPAQTSFDFLDGEFERSRRSRLAMIASLSISALVVMLLAGQGLNTRVETRSVEAELADARSEVLTAQIQLSARAPIAGIDAATASSFIQERAAIAAQLSVLELDLANTLSTIMASAPEGVTLASIDYDIQSKPGAGLYGPTVDCPDESSRKASPAPAVGNYDVVALSIRASAASNVDYRPWITALNEVPEFLEVRQSMAGQGSDLTVAVDVVMNPFARSERSTAFAVDSLDTARFDPCYDPDRRSAPADTTPALQDTATAEGDPTS